MNDFKSQQNNNLDQQDNLPDNVTVNSWSYYDLILHDKSHAIK